MCIYIYHRKREREKQRGGGGASVLYCTAVTAGQEEMPSRQSAINFSGQHKNSFDSIQSKIMSKKNIETDKIIRSIVCLFNEKKRKEQADRQGECKENVTYVWNITSSCNHSSDVTGKSFVFHATFIWPFHCDLYIDWRGEREREKDGTQIQAREEEKLWKTCTNSLETEYLS